MKYSEIKSLGSYKPASGGGSSYTAGTGIDISNNTISTKIDNSTIKTNSDGQLYAEVSSEATFKPFPDDFTTTTEASLTFERFIYNIRHSSGAAQGQAYVGEIFDFCLPWRGEGNAECTVVYITNNDAVLTVSSSDILPHYWTYNTASSLRTPADYEWKSSILQVTTMPSRALQDTIVQYVGETTSDYTQGYFYKCNIISGTPRTYEWVRLDVQPTEGIQTILKGADIEYTPTDSIGHQIDKIELPLDRSKIYDNLTLSAELFNYNTYSGLLLYNYNTPFMEVYYNNSGSAFYDNGQYIEGIFSWGTGVIDNVNNKYIITLNGPFSPESVNNVSDTYISCFSKGTYTLPDASLNVNKLARLTDGTNQVLIFSNGVKWSFLPHQVLHLTSEEIGSIPLTSLQDIKLWGVNLDVGQTVICTSDDYSRSYWAGNTYRLHTWDGSNYFFAEGFANKQNQRTSQPYDYTNAEQAGELDVSNFTDYKIINLGTYGCHIKMSDGCYLSTVNFTTGNTLPQTLDITPFEDESAQRTVYYYLNNVKVNNLVFKTNTTYFITINSTSYWDSFLNKSVVDFFVMVYNGEGGGGGSSYTAGTAIDITNNTISAKQMVAPQSGSEVRKTKSTFTDLTELQQFNTNKLVFNSDAYSCTYGSFTLLTANGIKLVLDTSKGQFYFGDDFYTYTFWDGSDWQPSNSIVTSGVEIFWDLDTHTVSFSSPVKFSSTSSWDNLLDGIEFVSNISPRNGESGIVPTPLLGDENKFLKGNGTWAVIDNNGIVLQANNNTTINGYQVPQLTAEQITQAYNGIVAGKQVVITDTTGLMHFAVNQADMVSDEPIISIEYFDIMELTYLTDGTIEYRSHNNQITLTQEQFDALTTYADHTDYRIYDPE